MHVGTFADVCGARKSSLLLDLPRRCNKQMKFSHLSSEMMDTDAGLPTVFTRSLTCRTHLST